MSEKHKIVSYKTFFIILLILLVFTSLSILIAYMNLGNLSVAGALLLANAKAILVLAYFMHLRFDKKMFYRMVVFVLAVFTVLIFITFLDYFYR